MTTDAIYEERGSDWSQQALNCRGNNSMVAAWPDLSSLMRRVWLARL